MQSPNEQALAHQLAREIPPHLIDKMMTLLLSCPESRLSPSNRSLSRRHTDLMGGKGEDPEPCPQVLAVGRPTSRKAREVGHPQLMYTNEINSWTPLLFVTAISKPERIRLGPIQFPSANALALLSNLAIIAQTFSAACEAAGAAIKGMKMDMKRVLTSAVVFALMALPGTAGGADGKSAADPGAAIAAKWIAAWNSHDPEKMLPLFTDDIFYEDVAFGEVSHGKAEVRKFALAEFEGVGDLELKLLRASIHGGHGTIEWTFSGTDKDVFKTGKKFSVRGVSVLDLRDGKISRNLDFYDAATIMRAVGVIPTPPAEAK
jgi:steroid delta-isomerase-like uncharacterized protein